MKDADDRYVVESRLHASLKEWFHPRLLVELRGISDPRAYCWLSRLARTCGAGVQWLSATDVV